MKYSRLKDTTYLPRQVHGAGKPSEIDKDGEQMHRINDPQQKRASLKTILGTLRKNNRSITHVGGLRTDSINNLDKLRQIIRNRKLQVHHKINEEVLTEKKRQNPDKGTSKDFSWKRDGAAKPAKPSRRLPDGKGLRTYATSDKRASVELGLQAIEYRANKKKEDSSTPDLDPEKRREARSRPHDLVPFTVQYTGPDKLPPKKAK